MKTLLHDAGLKFTMYPKITGNPDFLVGKVAVFCDSSFWHGHNWKKLKAQLEKGSNATYWIAHIAGNRRRDRHSNDVLRKQGYRVVRFWDDEVFKHPERCLGKLTAALK
jgi:DNA mismatch endonuclease (patch repair protein)